MPPEKNMQILLASRPASWPTEGDFRIVESPIPPVGDGQVLVRSLYLSLDPYQRGRMNDSRSYAAKVEIGSVMRGEIVGEVVQSKHPKFKAGDSVAGTLGWQQYALWDDNFPEPAFTLRKVDPPAVPLTAYLGAVGMPGVTALVGLNDIGQPKPGETVVVSAASGAVGSVVGQLAKAKDCRVVGVAGSQEKCDFVVKELGFDACVNHRDGNAFKALAAAVPKGIDVFFDNVGGPLLEAVLTLCNPYARIPVCGAISQYNVGSDLYGVKTLPLVIAFRVRLQGFVIFDDMSRWPGALAELAEGVRSGKIKYRETVAQGLENAPRAFIGMLKGENFGKQLVKIA
jgi:NADPH-dependent curcumin reductase CurA